MWKIKIWALSHVEDTSSLAMSLCTDCATLYTYFAPFLRLWRENASNIKNQTYDTSLFFFTAGVVRLPHVKSMLAARPLTNNYSIRFRLIVALETNRVARTQDMAQWPPYKVVGDAALHKPLSRYACCSTYCTFQCPNRFHRCSHLRWSGPKEFSPADLPWWRYSQDTSGDKKCGNIDGFAKSGFTELVQKNETLSVVWPLMFFINYIIWHNKTVPSAPLKRKTLFWRRVTGAG